MAYIKKLNNNIIKITSIPFTDKIWKASGICIVCASCIMPAPPTMAPKNKNINTMTIAKQRIIKLR